MADSLPVLVNLVANAMPFRKGIAITCDPQTVINDKKVTDHHAVIPTRNLKDADLSALPAGEKAVLELVALRLMCAVAQPHIYSETVVIAACAGGEFTTKGKTVKHLGWKALEDAYRAKMKDAEPKKEGVEKALPELTEGQCLSSNVADHPLRSATDRRLGRPLPHQLANQTRAPLIPINLFSLYDVIM